MTQRIDMPWTDDGSLEVLTFCMGDETFALEAVLVREILDLLPETAVPGADPLVGSVINFRGRIIPLADLRLAFGMQDDTVTSESRIVVIELFVADEPLLIGLKTDRVNEVATLFERHAEPPPALGMRWPREQVRCLVRQGQDLIVLPDLLSLFSTLAAGSGDQTVH